MNLEQVANKYSINRNTLNAKDDALKVSVKSIQELVREMEKRNVDKDMIEAVKRIGEFLYDVSNSTIG
jgi:predicted metal-dependent TIM-barrel fold hydrolase